MPPLTCDPLEQGLKQGKELRLYAGRPCASVSAGGPYFTVDPPKQGLNRVKKEAIDVGSVDQRILHKTRIEITASKMDMITSDIKEEEHQYRFLSPWLALNQKDYSKYRKRER